MKRFASTSALFITIIFSLLFCHSVYGAQETDEKRVLFLSSYSYAWDTVQMQIEGIKEGIGDGIVLDYEFMDTKRFPDEESLQVFYEGFKYRMQHVAPYDVVILGDDAALNFAAKYRNELFSGIPLVFEGINNTDYAIELAKDPLITGVLEQLSFEKNINFAKTLYPNAKRVVSILDNSVTGEAERKSFYKNAENYPDLTFSEINTSELTTDQLITTLSTIDSDTILIYIVMTEDASGVQYTSSQSIKLVSKYANVPALRMVSGGIGTGLLGGNIVSMELSGKIAAQIATEIVNGKDPADFDVIVDSPNIYCVDENVMRRFNLDLSLIPEGAEVVNHKLPFLQRNQEAILPGIIILILLLFVIGLLFFKNIKQDNRAKGLEEDKENLTKTSLSDFLTGVYNRTCLYADLTELILHNSICSLFIFDVDGFKQINDTYGHNVGDEVLKEVGRRLKSISNKDFTPYRYGGDEFVCILHNNFQRQIETYANQCMELFKPDFQLQDGRTITVHISLGISVCPDDTSTMKQLVEYADKAMYTVKKNGKNAYARYRDIKDK